MAVPDELFDGLLLYLQIRDWALEKMKTQPIGGQQLDLEIHQYLYLSNALASVDLVGESYYGKDFRTPAYATDYDKALIAAFDALTRPDLSIAAQEAYAYVRELRNSVVHRGLGSANAGPANESHVFALCPASVVDRAGKNTYRRPWKYVVELAEATTRAFNSVIYAELQKHQFFTSEESKIVSASDVKSAIDTCDAMPDWAKDMAHKTFAQLDLPKLTAEARANLLRNLKIRLGVI